MPKKTREQKLKERAAMKARLKQKFKHVVPAVVAQRAVYVPQGEMAVINDYHNTNFDWIYTTGMDPCVATLIMNDDRMALGHVDSNVTEKNVTAFANYLRQYIVPKPDILVMCSPQINSKATGEVASLGWSTIQIVRALKAEFHDCVVAEFDRSEFGVNVKDADAKFAFEFTKKFVDRPKGVAYWDIESVPPVPKAMAV